METRDFKLRIKGLTDSGTFQGFASTYGNTDLVGDVILPGAFNQAIASQGNGFPLLWAHDQAQPIGLAKLTDSKNALVCEGNLLMTDPGAQKAYRFMKAGVVKGLSIGFNVDDPSTVSYDDDGNRILRTLHLHEVSVVAVPANQSALITSVKNLGQVERYFKGLRVGDPADREMIRHLHAINESIKTLLAGVDPCDPEDDENCENDDPFLAEYDKALLLELKALAAQAQELAA